MDAVERDEPSLILELCPVDQILRPNAAGKMKTITILPKGGYLLALVSTALTHRYNRHHVFQPAGKAIPAGSKCPTCGWDYIKSETRKVRVWDLDTRVRNMLRNKIIVEVRVHYIHFILIVYVIVYMLFSIVLSMLICRTLTLTTVSIGSPLR
jgi:hypothetical protein